MLPSELLFHICSFLHSDPALAALARVSPTCAAVAQPVLYRRLTVRSDPGPLPTLAKSPRLAALVRSLAVHRAPPHDLLARALANMRLLVELDLFLDAPHVLFDATSYPRLQRLATSLPWSPLLVRFLHKCPAVSQLYLDSPSPLAVPPLPPAFLPALAHFTGPTSLAVLLVPHRPVQHIDLTSSPHDLGLTPDLALSLSLSDAPVLALAATTSASGRGGEDENLVGVLRTLAASMPHLRHLRVVTNTYADASTLPPIRVFTHSYFENITDSLSSLPDLQSCEIWGFHWISSKKHKPYSSVSASTTTWHSPAFTISNNTTTNFLDDLYQDLIFPY